MRRTTVANYEEMVRYEIQPLFERFIKTKIATNCSDYHIYHLRSGYNYFIKNYNLVYVDEITEDKIVDIICAEKDKGITNTRTFNTKLCDFRSFIYWLMDRKLIEPFKIQKLKEKEVPKETYTMEELRRLVEKPHSTNWVDWRNWAVVNYLIATGNRASSVLNIRVGDLDLENKLVRIRTTKNGKPFICPITKSLVDVLKIYLRTFYHDDEDFLFQNYNGEQWKMRGFQDEMAKWNKKHGVNKTGIHLYRHTFAKNFLLAGGSITQLQHLLQHSSPEMSLHYAKLYSINEITYNYEELNPLNRL